MAASVHSAITVCLGLPKSDQQFKLLMQIPVPIELSQFIKHYLFIEVKTDRIKKYRLFSNGNTGLVAILEGHAKFGKTGETASSDSLVFGQFTRFTDLEFSTDTKILVVVFQPYGLYTLTGIPGNEMQNLIVDAELVFGKAVNRLHETVQEHASSLEIAAYLNRYFKDHFLRKGCETPLLVSDIVQRILLRKGGMAIKDILDGYSIHERKLQRIFSECIGLSPKKFIQIVKLHSFLGLMKTGSSEQLTRLVYEAGYYDQSHLIKEFRSITGMAPSEYAKSLALAVTLVELK